MKYRTKPIEIEAIQYDGTNMKEIEEFVGHQSVSIYRYWDGPNLIWPKTFSVYTEEGEKDVHEKDYIIIEDIKKYNPQKLGCWRSIYLVKEKDFKKIFTEAEV